MGEFQNERIRLECTNPFQISWFMIIIAKNAMHLYIARLLGGISSGGSFVLVPLFVAEIAEDR